MPSAVLGPLFPHFLNMFKITIDINALSFYDLNKFKLNTFKPEAGLTMICTVYQPSSETIRAFLRQQADVSFSYPEVGHSRHTPPAGYVVDHNRICLGEGEACFNAARDALHAWRMFPTGWVKLCWPTAPIAPGTDVAILAHWGALWWLNACRIVYVIDEHAPQRRCGFAYGALASHPARGEERFCIEMAGDGTVWYDLLAFSKPNRLLTRLGYPFVRRLQKRFAAQSLKAMAEAVSHANWPSAGGRTDG